MYNGTVVFSLEASTVSVYDACDEVSINPNYGGLWSISTEHDISMVTDDASLSEYKGNWDHVTYLGLLT